MQDLSVLKSTILQRLDIKCSKCSNNTACADCFVNKLMDALAAYRNATTQVNSVLVMLAEYMLNSNKNCKKK